MKTTSIIPIPDNKSLEKLGADLEEARIKRHWVPI